jgi:hypothetical protein
MSPSTLLSKIESSYEIRRHFEWHLQQQRALLLLCAANDGPLPALVQGFDLARTTVQVLCTGLLACGTDSNLPYAVIGSRLDGANFLASGRMTSIAGTSDCFALSLPQWIDVSQSRESYRCLAPFEHFLRFSSTDPHLNDIVCRVHDISLGGLAVEWEPRHGLPLEVSSVTDNAILHARNNNVQLGSLRVAHVSQIAHSYIIGLDFVKDIPRTFNAVVLDVQRAEGLSMAIHKSA